MSGRSAQMLEEIAPLLRHFVEDVPCFAFGMRTRFLDELEHTRVVERHAVADPVMQAVVLAGAPLHDGKLRAIRDQQIIFPLVENLDHAQPSCAARNEMIPASPRPSPLSGPS